MLFQNFNKHLKTFKINTLLLLLVGLFLFFSISMLLDDPLIWPDEALYGDIARNIAQENRLGTDLLRGMIKGIENHAYWIPPFYMYSLGLWIKFFGYSIETQRLFSVFLGAVLLFVLYQIAKHLILVKSKTQLIPLSLLLLFSLDPAFIKASRLSRPEMLVLVLTGLSLLFYLKTLSKKKSQFFTLIASALLLGSALTTHLIAIGFVIAFGLHLIYCYWKKILSFKHVLSFTIFFSIPIIIWLLSIFPNYDLLTDQLNIISNSRSYTIPWYINVTGFPLFLQLNYFSYIIVSLLFVFFTTKNQKPEYILLSLILILSWVFITLGEIFWYTIYPIVFVYLGLTILAGHSFTTPGKSVLLKSCRILIASIGIFLLISHFASQLQALNAYKGSEGYRQFTDQIIESIPAGKTVYLSSIPDAYFAFEPNRNKLFEYPAFHADKESVKKVMAETDYIIFSNFFSPEIISGYQDKYMSKNMESVKELSAPYHILIIKLKDKNSRVNID